MKPPIRSPLHGSVFALALTATALLGAVLLRPFLEPNAYLPFIAAVWISAWLYGRVSGLLATAASSFCLLYFFVWPNFSGAAAPAWNSVAQLAAFTVMGALITWVTAGWKESRGMLASTLSSMGDAVVVTDAHGCVTFMNPLAETLTGWPVAEARGKPISEILLLGGKSREPLENPLMRALRDRMALATEDAKPLVSRNGAEAPIAYAAAPVRDRDGSVRGGVVVFRDVGKRIQLEQQSKHVEKMDAVGRLAGGVAGDFNNVLTVITGYAELLRAELAAADPNRHFVDEIIYAGERAAALTRHLLAFSRSATAQPRVIDLNAVVSGMEPMLRRLLGENIDLMLLTSPGACRVKADPAQIEQAVVNLAANARDAMPHGGKFVLETANAELDESSGKKLGVKPGSYVMLAVSDTGVGMDPEARSRIFEPFFTTKAPGKGSGLGLATVYGAIRQLNGQVTVYSQPGCGTIFEIYLPAADEAPAAAPAAPVRKLSPKGSETILLVDDEEGVRKLVHAVLQANGYGIIEAGSGASALAAYEKNGHKIDLVLTDVVMPQMSGFELGKQLESRAPALKILYMSGYRDNALGVSGQPPKAFLHKPFTPDVLLSKVREVLDTEKA